MLRMMVTQIGLVIGEKIKCEEGLMELKDPRVLSPIHNQPGKFQISTILGSPVGLQIDEKTFGWDVSDESLIASYIESISSLTLVKRPTDFKRSDLKLMN